MLEIKQNPGISVLMWTNEILNLRALFDVSCLHTLRSLTIWIGLFKKQVALKLISLQVWLPLLAPCNGLSHSTSVVFNLFDQCDGPVVRASALQRYGIESLSFLGCKLWNNLPDDFKSIKKSCII